MKRERTLVADHIRPGHVRVFRIAAIVLRRGLAVPMSLRLLLYRSLRRGPAIDRMTSTRAGVGVVTMCIVAQHACQILV